MFSRLFEWLGYRQPEDFTDFVMTGAVVAPFTAFIGSDAETAIVVMFACLLPIFFVFPWAQAQEELREAEQRARDELKRRISGKAD